VVRGRSVTTTQRPGAGAAGAAAEYYHTGAGAYITRPPLSFPTGISVNLRLLGVTGRTETRLYMRVPLAPRWCWSADESATVGRAGSAGGGGEEEEEVEAQRDGRGLATGVKTTGINTGVTCVL